MLIDVIIDANPSYMLTHWIAECWLASEGWLYERHTLSHTLKNSTWGLSDTQEKFHQSNDLLLKFWVADLAAQLSNSSVTQIANIADII